MLKIQKNGVSFTLANDYETIVATKVDGNRVMRIITITNGTTADFASKVNTICKWTLEEFKLFSEIQASSETNELLEP